MSNIVQEAQELLDSISDLTPFKLNEATSPDEQKEVIASIRADSGWPVILPHPEAQSLMVGERRVFDFFLAAPRIIEGLLALQKPENSAK